MLSELAPLNSRAPPYSSNQALLLLLYRLTVMSPAFRPFIPLLFSR